MHAWAALCVVFMAALAPAAEAGISNDAGRTWKTIAGEYRSGFAAGGADMLAVLASDFRSRSPATEQRQIMSMAECARGASSLAALRASVEAFIVKNPLPPPPNSPSDFPVVAADVGDVLLECPRSAPASTGTPANLGYRTAGKLRIGGAGARAVLVYVTAAEWGSAATPAFRNGYVAGATNTLLFVAGLLQKHPADGVRQQMQRAAECVRTKYTVLDALRLSLDGWVQKDLAGGHNYTVASTLSVVLIDCL